MFNRKKKSKKTGIDASKDFIKRSSKAVKKKNRKNNISEGITSVINELSGASKNDIAFSATTSRPVVIRAKKLPPKSDGKNRNFILMLIGAGVLAKVAKII